MRRVIATFNVPDDHDKHDVSDVIEGVFGSEADATVWEWDGFWADYSDGVVTPADDSTMRIGRHRGGTTT